MAEAKGRNRIKEMLKIAEYTEGVEKPLGQLSPVEKLLYVVMHAFGSLSVTKASEILLDALSNHASEESQAIEAGYDVERLKVLDGKPEDFVKTMAILSLRESYRNEMSEQHLRDLQQLTEFIQAMAGDEELQAHEHKTIRHFYGEGAHVVTAKKIGRGVYLKNVYE